MRMVPILVYLFYVALISVQAEGNTLGKYQLILDKQLLGSVKAAPPPAPRPEPEITPPSWAQDYRMTMMTLDEDRVRVGLQHIQNNSAFLLIEGEDSHTEFTLVSANYDQGSAEVRRLGDLHRFELQSGPAVAARAQRVDPSPVSTNVRGANRRGIRPPGVRPVPREQESNEAEEPQVRRFETREELEAHLREQQMDAIRTGKPPLPIPLTEEMDDQLVREGVLDPRGE